jgi:IS30 family transposase
MGCHYDQLNESEREVIGRLLSAGRSKREIARVLERSASTISREIRRNSTATKIWHGGYKAARAQALTERRRNRGRTHKLARQPDLRELVRDSLAMGWSPEQIAGRLALLHGRTVISHESIYRFIYHRSAQKDPSWHRLLWRAKHRRGRLGARGGSPVDRIQNRVPLSARPHIVADRRQPEHWEADLMLFRRYGQAVLVTHERSSRFTVVTRQPNKAAQPVLDSLLDCFSSLPPQLRRSITFDNGTEFAHHHRLAAALGMQTFFCDPHAPWQKGGIENAIGRLRRPLPRKSDLSTITQAELDELTDNYNQTPRQCLGFKTPAEVFNLILNRVALET